MHQRTHCLFDVCRRTRAHRRLTNEGRHDAPIGPRAKDGCYAIPELSARAQLQNSAGPRRSYFQLEREATRANTAAFGKLSRLEGTPRFSKLFVRKAWRRWWEQRGSASIFS